jgi:hypothetical protein
MLEFAAILALICAVVIGVRKGAHKEGTYGLIAFVILFGIAFVIIGAKILFLALIVS